MIQIAAKADRVSDALRYVIDGIFPSSFSSFLKNKGRKTYDIGHDCADQSLEWMLLCTLSGMVFFLKVLPERQNAAVTQSLPWENIISKSLDMNCSSEISIKTILFPCLLLHEESVCFHLAFPY